MKTYTHRSATISDCGKYRYVLERSWGPQDAVILFIGLNPSTADDSKDDPTVRRCVGFARALGFDRLLIGNLFAARSPSPGVLSNLIDPVGPENDAWLIKLQDRARRVVVAWGNGGRLRGRSAQVLRLIRYPYCFGKTQVGEPLHPLYLSRKSGIKPFLTK